MKGGRRNASTAAGPCTAKTRHEIALLNRTCKCDFNEDHLCWQGNEEKIVLVTKNEKW
jgi:hypothetical protein